jgi:hypothetical protein
MYGKGAIIFATWSYVIAHTKPDNLVELNPVMLAATFGQCTADEVEQAIEALCSPDPQSRSKRLQGRRLVKKGEFMYFVVNADKYRTLPNERERREYFTQKQREHRERVKACQTGMSNESNPVKPGQPLSTHTQYSDTEEVQTCSLVPSEQDIYNAYPRKVGRAKALSIIKLKIKLHGATNILERTIAYAKTQPLNDQFTPYPATWFYQERYNDDPATWTPRNRQSQSERQLFEKPSLSKGFKEI